MKNSSKQIDRTILKSLEPLNQLNPILLDELAAKSIIEETPAGRIICRHGEKDAKQIYLLSGQIEVASPGDTKVNIIKAKSPLKTPISQGIAPNAATLKTKTNSSLLYIDADLLELLMSDAPSINNTYEVTEISTEDEGDDWMLTFLQSPAFLQLPTENIQKLLTHMDEIPVKKGQVVIQQNAKDDNYYIIKSGSCNVHRRPYKDAANVLLAVLPTGSGFGEEALISNGTRNATITMRENGSLMRLKKKDFLNLLITPLISYFEHSETKEKLNQGCVVIDVRSEADSKQKPLDGAVNIPLSMLRMKFDSLNTDREYLLVCNDGSQSAAAAFLMIQGGFKCAVLKGGLNNSSSVNKKPVSTNKKATATNLTKNKEADSQVAIAKKQTEQLAEQQKQIKAAREKSEKDILKHKKELSDSRARIVQKNQQVSSTQNEANQLKEKAAQELAKAQAESKAMELRQQEIEKAMQKAEKMMQQTQAAAEQARVKAEKEAAEIKQRAIEEAEYLKAEVEAARQKMEQDSVRLKQEEEIIKSSALKIKHEADEIRQAAVNDAEQVRTEIESTRALLSEKLQRAEAEEKRKQDEILSEAKKRADQIAKSQTQQANKEAEAIRLKAQQDATALHNELAQTRKQIEEEAARVINQIKEQSKQAEPQKVTEIKEEVLVEVVAEADVDYSAVSIPGMSSIEPINDDVAQRKAEAIKAKLSQSQQNNVLTSSKNDINVVKVHKTNDKTILEGEDDLFVFKAPNAASVATPSQNDNYKPTVSHRTKSESVLTQIDTSPRDSIVIHPQQEQGSAYKNNPFLNNEDSNTAGMNYSQQASGGEPDFNISKNTQNFNRQAYMKQRNASKSNTLAIAASFILILAGAVFTLHASNTLKVQSIAALFNSGNDTTQPAVNAVAKTKTIGKNALRADTKVDVKKKVSNKMDDIMQGWQNVLDEAENPKKLKK